MAATLGPTPDTTSPRCPCGTGEVYDACCGRWHRGEALPPTAEALMRSRYTAFALRDTDYLQRTWHPGTRPADGELDLASDQRWLRLDVVETSGGGPFDDEGTVTFEARWRSDASAGAPGPGRGVLRERSSFVRADVAGVRRWLYVDGEVS